MLDRMATEAADAADSDTEKDIEQLRGLAAQQDDDAFLPLRREELGPEFPRRMRGLQRLIDDATECHRTVELRHGSPRFERCPTVQVEPD